MHIFIKIMGFSGSRFENRAAVSLYIAAVSYNLTLAMLNVLVPLYALHLGYNLKTMGAIVASQAVFQLGLRLFGGLLADRFGEKLVMFISFSSALLASLMFIFVNTVAGMVGAQVFVGLSRSVYWNAAQSYGSRVSEAHTDHILGRFLGYGSGGQIIGAIIAGTTAEAMGYRAAFAVCSGFCAAALLSAFSMPGIPRKGAYKTMRQILKPLPRIFTNKALWMGVIVAFMGSAQSALVGSTYPAYFKNELGFTAEGFGIYRSIYAFGLVIIGFAFSGITARFGQKTVFALCMLGMGVLTILTPGMGGYLQPVEGAMTSSALAAIGALMLALGAFFGISRVLYPVMAAQNSTPTQRGVTMSVVGMGWAAGQLFIPLIFGYIAQAYGLSNSFYIAGIWITAVGLATPLLYRRLLPEEKKREKTP